MYEQWFHFKLASKKSCTTMLQIETKIYVAPPLLIDLLLHKEARLRRSLMISERVGGFYSGKI